MSLLTPTFSSFPLFTSFSEESRKFEAEADHLWADMQSSMLKTSPNGSKGSSEDLINNNTSKLFQKHNFGENNSWSDIHKAMFERQTLQSPLKDEIHSVTTNSDGSFEVSVAFTGFKADELSIKVLDNSLVIEAKHEEKNPETGKVQNYIQMQRRFLLPTSFDTNALTSSLSEDGVLTIAAPSKVKHQVLSPKKIEITQASSGVPETH